MNLKRTISLALSLALTLGLLAGCGGGSDTPAERTPEELTQLYADAINNCGSEMVEYNPVISVYDPENEPIIDALLEMLGLTAEDMTAFGLSLSLMNVKAYGLALIMPAEGKEQTVLDGLNGFVTLQQSNFEMYLEDQYEVAKAAKVETLADGTVLLVMCEDADAVYESITAALSA